MSVVRCPRSRSVTFNFVKCGMVKMWLVVTGCGYDLVSKRETGMIKRFVSKAKVPITLHTASGPTRTNNIANMCESWMRTSPPAFSKILLRFLLLVTDALSAATHKFGLLLKSRTSFARMG